MAVKDGITDFHLKEFLKIVLAFPLDGAIYIANYTEDDSTEFHCASFDSFEVIRSLPVCDFEVTLCNIGLNCSSCRLSVNVGGPSPRRRR